MKRPSRSKVEALEGVVTETNLLSQRLRSFAEQAHPDPNLTPAMRSVLSGLADHGPRTVPEIARARPASRQHVQSLVNRLRQLEMVELAPNPAHKRSRLVQLTGKGQRAIAEVRKEDQARFARAPIPVSKKSLRQAAETLRALREMIENPDWQREAGGNDTPGDGPEVGFREKRARQFGGDIL